MITLTNLTLPVNTDNHIEIARSHLLGKEKKEWMAGGTLRRRQ